MATFFLHVGLCKTGTTALQKFLCLNRASIQQYGFSYPDLRIDRVDHNHLANAWGEGVLGSGEATKNGSVASLWAEVADQAVGDNQIILSAEVLGVAFSYHHDRLVEVVKELAPHDVKVVVYLRRQDLHAESWFNQLVKAGILYGDLVPERLPGVEYDYYVFVSGLAQAVGKENVLVRPYEKRQFRGGDIYQDFCATIGLPWCEAYVVPTHDSNPRLSQNAFEFQKLANEIVPDSVQTDFNHFVQIVSLKIDQGSLTQKQSLLSREARASLLQKYSASNKRVAQQFLNRSDGILFEVEPLYGERDDSSGGLDPAYSVLVASNMWESWKQYCSDMPFAEYNFRRYEHLKRLKRSGQAFCAKEYFFHKFCHSIGKRLVPGWPDSDEMNRRLKKAPLHGCRVDEHIFRDL